MRMVFKFFSLTALSLPALLSGCSNAPELPSVTSLMQPYRISVRQGNYLTQEMVAKLKPGQTKDQVRFALGSPLIEDAFHAQRWDYVYRFKTGDGEVSERRFTVFFDNDKLVRVSGDVEANSAQASAADLSNATQRNRVIEIGGATVDGSASDAKPASKPWWKFYE